jgi:TPR repeat protein
VINVNGIGRGEEIMNFRANSSKSIAFALSFLMAMCVTAVAGEQKYDESTPLDELKVAASGGDSDAMLGYGSRLIQGQGVDTNTTEGISWVQKSADAGNAQAWYVLGVVYSNGIGVELDMPKSIEYYRKGAEAGDADCQVAMGMIYQAGERIPGGVATDPVEAVKWYGMAAEQGQLEGIYHLATMNARGQGIEKNEKEGVKLYRKGAELGSADCVLALGRCYLHGIGVEVDSVMAYALFSASLDGIEYPQQKEALTAKRDELAKELTEEQLGHAQPIIEEWKSKIKN